MLNFTRRHSHRSSSFPTRRHFFNTNSFFASNSTFLFSSQPFLTDVARCPSSPSISSASVHSFISQKRNYSKKHLGKSACVFFRWNRPIRADLLFISQSVFFILRCSFFVFHLHLTSPLSNPHIDEQHTTPSISETIFSFL